MSAPSNSNARPRTLHRASIATLVAVVVTLFGVVVGATPVSAHTSFVGSDPANGAVVAEPVGEITLEFTGVSKEAGDGFVVLDPSGQVREPTSVTTADDKVFVLAFDPALDGGVVGVRWSVRAGDNHPIEGSFSFTVGADSSTSADDDMSSMTPEEMTAMGSGDMSSMSPEEMAAMDEFLQVDPTRPGETTAMLGRLMSIGSIVLALGFLVFAATTLRGSRGEVDGLITAVRIIGAVMVVGAAIEYFGIARIADESLSSAWSSSAGGAIVLRTLAGLAIAVGLVATTTPRRASGVARSLSSAVDLTTPMSRDFVDLEEVPRASQQLIEPARDRAGVLRQWQPDQSSWLAYIGVGLAIMSFWFDGHTVTKGLRPLHAFANSVHVVAGSVWVGGIIAMAAVLWLRRRHGRPSGALELVVRFSSVASVALGAVVVAGLVMAVSILDSFGELTSTQWGQTFLLKSAAAGLAMVAGAYNHFRLMPALERDPGDAALHDSVRTTVTAEAILLGFVVVVTASLVAAAS
jgi:copper transport protein